MQISGIHHYQVFQRGAKNTADIKLHVTATIPGPIHCSITSSGKTVRGFKNQKIGSARTNTTRCVIKGLPCGGPYNIEISSGNKKRVLKHILVGDLWVMGGQSNMQGIGNMRDALKPHKMVHMFDMRDEWRQAKDPINLCPISVDKAHHGQDQFRTDDDAKTIEANQIKGVGPGLAFARYLYKKTGVPIGLIPCAKGGSSMQQWDPKLKQRGGDSLYGACLRRIQAAGGKITGMIWSQGCSDASEKAAKKYTRRMQTLIANLRADCKQNFPWILSQINGFYDTERWGIEPVGWTNIRKHQAELGQHVKKYVCISSVDLDLDDGIHISAIGQHRVGERMAKVALQLAGYSKQKYTSPYIANISAKRGNKIAQTDFGSYAVKIKGLNGSLQSDGRHVLGFSLRDKDGNKCRSIYKAWIHEDEIILQTELKDKELRKYKLYYGYGTTPLCNITDSEDMALLANGPFDLKNT